MTRQQFRRLVAFMLVGIAVLTAFYIAHRPFLLRDPTLDVTYIIAGVRHDDGEVFRTKFSSPIRFVHLPKAPREFQWFGYSVSHKWIGQGPLVRESLFGWVATDPPGIGIALNDPKLDSPAPWVVDRSENALSFSSPSLAVVVTPQ